MTLNLFLTVQFHCPMDSPPALSCQPIENSKPLHSDIFIVVSDAQSSPPHIGMLFSGFYSSLTNKGFETSIRVEAFLKKMSAIHSPCIFIQLIPHPVFSINFLSELFISILHQTKKADGENFSCLSPIIIFLQEGYQLKLKEIQFAFQLIPHLQNLQLTKKIFSFGMNTHDVSQHNYRFPDYGTEEIKKRIKNQS